MELDWLRVQQIDMFDLAILYRSVHLPVPIVGLSALGRLVCALNGWCMDGTSGAFHKWGYPMIPLNRWFISWRIHRSKWMTGDTPMTQGLAPNWDDGTIRKLRRKHVTYALVQYYAILILTWAWAEFAGKVTISCGHSPAIFSVSSHWNILELPGSSVPHSAPLALYCLESWSLATICVHLLCTYIYIYRNRLK